MAAAKSKSKRPGGHGADRPAATERAQHGANARRTVSGLGIVGLDHVQLSIPRGEEALARLFYEGLLGLREVSKPRELRRRGGCWFVGDAVAIHLGAVRHFRAATRAHPAFVVEDLEHARRRLVAAGLTIDEDVSGLGARRFYTTDPFGNRIELVDGADRDFSRRQPRRSPRARTEP